MRFFKYYLIILFWTYGCDVKSTNKVEFKDKADALLDKIANGTADEEFPVKYFPFEQTKAIMYDLRNKCDFKNRQGHFLNEYYSTDKSKVSLIYEYYLKCDSIRFVLTYNIKDSDMLYEFKIEPIEKDNPMIVDQTKRLKGNLSD